MNKWTMTVGAAAMFLAGAAFALPPASPIIKNGSCPAGYSSSGNYCKPGSNARYAVPKNGSCPAGYSSSGKYCLASSNNSKTAIPKIGSCPGGCSSSGNYCLCK